MIHRIICQINYDIFIKTSASPPLKGPYALRLTAAMIILLLQVQCKSAGLRQDSADLSAVPDPTGDGASQVATWSEARVREAEAEFRREGGKYFPSPTFWGAEVVYEVMVDRFNNGTPTNDQLLVSDTQKGALLNGYRGIAEYRHGGDLKGIADRLPYLADLGVTALWITPVMTNADASYHGYCTSDFGTIDPNFGTTIELVNLVKDAHRRDIRVILDIVVNHMCDGNTHYASAPSRDEHERCAADLNSAEVNGSRSQSSSQKDLIFSAQFFKPLKSKFFFNRCGANTQSDMEGDGPASVYGDFTAAMLDLDTRNYDLQQIYTNLMKYWVARADVDGFRLDAVKHITPDFTAYLSTTMRAYAETLGKRDFYMVAEIAGPSSTIARHLGRMTSASRSRSPATRLSAPVSPGVSVEHLASLHEAFPFPGTNAVYDFAHAGIARDVLLNQRPSRTLEQYFTLDPYRADLVAQGDPRLNLTHLEIHDWERFLSARPDDTATAILGLSYLAAAGGIPIIYYGQEQGFTGRCPMNRLAPGVNPEDVRHTCEAAPGPERHATYRQDMFASGIYRLGSAVKKIDDLAMIGPSDRAGTASSAADPFVDRSHEVYKSARRMLYLRRSCAALSYGNVVWRWATDDAAGVFAFSRVDGQNEALVVVNTANSPQAIPTLAVASSGTTYVSTLDKKAKGLPGAGSTLEFRGATIAARSVLVFVPEGKLGRYSPYLGTHLCRDADAFPPEERAER